MNIDSIGFVTTCPFLLSPLFLLTPRSWIISTSMFRLIEPQTMWCFVCKIYCILSMSIQRGYPTYIKTILSTYEDLANHKSALRSFSINIKKDLCKQIHSYVRKIN